MATGSAGREDGQPPALPVKQHRSRSYRGSSADSDFYGLQHQISNWNDVFIEPTDCHAAQCPIHQRYDVSRHQMRFFSDGTPPPVPKKRLTRTFSLPGPKETPPLSPRPHLHRHTQHFDNPLYMLAPIHDTYVCEETAEVNRSVRRTAAVTFSQLTFDTPDEHLCYLFSCFDDPTMVSQGIEHCHLLFLRSVAQRVEARVQLQREVSQRDISSYQPQDFQLGEDSEPKQVGDSVYYSLSSPKFPGRELALRVHEHTEASTTHHDVQPSHVNVQHVVAHFQPSSVLKDSSCKAQIPDATHVPKSDCTATKTPCGGSNEYGNYTASSPVSMVQHLLEKGHCVSVERDLPQVTLEDFVQDSSSAQSTDSLLYDKQVCFLVLQVLMGAQHLYSNSAKAAELRPRGIFLMWPGKERGRKKEEEILGGNVSEMQTGLKTERNRLKEKMWDKNGRIQMLWRTRGCPRVVLSHQMSAHSAPQPFVSIKAQIRDLIQYCLAPQDGPKCLSTSSYRRGLQSLASQLHHDSNRPQMANMVTMLQVLLWGPMPTPGGSVTSNIHNWLTVKRALLVMKLAEKGLIPDQSDLDWEDCLCLQYLAFTDPETVVNVSSQLQLSD